VTLANTARMVMAKNAKNGIAVPSLFRALADLADEGYTHVAVQSLHLIPGAEFDGISSVAKAQEGLPKGLEKISVGASLMASNEDCEKVASALIGSLPKERKAGEPVVFVGHGTHHGVGGMAYPALQWHAANRDAKIFISTIEGTPDRKTTLKALGKPAAKKNVLWIAPLLGLAGDHAVNDLYGDEDDSWKSVLTGEGWQVKEAFTPLYAVPAIREIWFAHLDAALEALK
jgi:sirohydrochlorin cobaltochelatase